MFFTDADGRRDQPDRHRLGSRPSLTELLNALAQLKLEPQPQVRVAFGFVIVNPAWLSPSL